MGIGWLIKNTVKWFCFTIRYLLQPSKNVRFGLGVALGRGSSFEGANRIGRGTQFSGRMGYGSYISEHCYLLDVQIGRFCCIGRKVSVASGKHPTKGWASVHPAFFSTARQCGVTFVSKNKFNETEPPVVIENDVWIGSETVIRGGVHIGNGAVIAAGALVTRDVPPYTIVAGCPAPPKGKRFDDETIENLLRICWWNRPPEWLKQNAAYFEDTSALIQKCQEDSDL